MRLFSLSGAGLLLAAGCLLTVGQSWGTELQRPPLSLLSRWQCTLQAERNWQTPGFVSTGWQPVAEVAGRYPAEMKPEEQILTRFMWAPDRNAAGPVYFRRHLWLPGEIEAASLFVSADDYFDAYINGYGIGQGRVAHEGFLFDLQPYLQSGANVLALKAWDVNPPARSLMVTAEITQSWPAPQGAGWVCTLVTPGQGTDRQWPSAGPRWTQPKYDDRAWLPAVADTAPPIKLPDLPPYHCITIPGGLPEYGSALFRRTFEVDGLPLIATAVILADDSYELYVNGTLVAWEKRAERAYYPLEVDLRQYLQPGKNVLAVKVTNDWGPGRLYCVPTVTMIL
jgi:hypothetical protein